MYLSLHDQPRISININYFLFSFLLKSDFSAGFISVHIQMNFSLDPPVRYIIAASFYKYNREVNSRPEKALRYFNSPLLIDVRVGGTRRIQAN